MSIDAMWQVKFGPIDGDNVDAGAGIIIFVTNRVFGGDSCFYYVGGYSVSGGSFRSNLHVRRHAAGLPSAIGLDDAHVLLEGDYHEERFTAMGTVTQNRSMAFLADFVRLADLP